MEHTESTRCAVGAVGVDPLVSCGKAAFFMGKAEGMLRQRVFLMGKPPFYSGKYAIDRAVEWIMAIEIVETMPLIAWC